MKKVSALFILSMGLLTAANECKISLDVGHSPGRPGATSSRGVSEYAFNRRVALYTYHMLQENGIDAFFINSNEKDIPLSERSKEAVMYGGTHFISFHHDSVKEKHLSKWQYKKRSRYYCDKFSGHGLFVSKKNSHFKESLQIASSIGKELRTQGLHPSYHHTEDIKGERKALLDRPNGVYQFDNLVVLKKTPMPSVLIECGIILNREEELKVWGQEHISKIATAVTKTFLSVCKRGH